MRNQRLVVLLAALLVAGAPADAEEKAKPPGEIVARVVALGEAYRDGDVEKLENLITAAYSHINDGSPPIGREEWLDANRERAKKIKDGSIKVESYKMSDVRVTRAASDAAIVTALVSAAETLNGERREYHVRATTFWVKEDGEWKRAAFHDSPVP
jgi:uncharacterized protein (TIGR02246 family)